MGFFEKDTQGRMKAAAPFVKEGKIVDQKDTVALLEAVIRPFDKVNIEGNNQSRPISLPNVSARLTRRKSMTCTWYSPS